MRDALFGDIEYDGFGWTGECSLPIFGEDAVARLFVPCDETREIEASQNLAFAEFQNRKSATCKLAEAAIFSYYQEIAPDYRVRFGPTFADQWAPEISSADELTRLVTLTELIVQQSYATPPERIIGLIFDCTWDQSLGLAVKFVDEQLSEVGTQDIVL